MSYKTKLLFLLFLLPCSLSALAQDSELSVDDLYKQGRELAFDGKRSEGRAICRKALEKSPDYHDIRIFIARTYAWDKKYDSARAELSTVLTAKENSYDAFDVLLDVELWSDQYETALSKSELALSYYPNSDDFLYKKAKALDNLERKKEAAQTLRQLLDVNPGHKKGHDMMKRLRNQMALHKATLTYDFVQFNDIFDKPWHEGAFSISRRTPLGSIILRGRSTFKFDNNDNQIEIDAYPGLWDGAYAYLSIGWAPDSNLFPFYRTGGELYQSLPKSFEASVGFRYLFFDPTSDVTILTASAGKYIGDYWISLRAYLTPKSLMLYNVDSSSTQRTMSRSVNLLVRKYFQSGDDYLGFIASTGLSPEVRNSNIDLGVLVDPGVDVEYVDLLNAVKFGAVYQRRIGDSWLFLIDASYAMEQRKYFDLNIISVGTAISYHF